MLRFSFPLFSHNFENTANTCPIFQLLARCDKLANYKCAKVRIVLDNAKKCLKQTIFYDLSKVKIGKRVRHISESLEQRETPKTFRANKQSADKQ